jgi:thioredoxin reductase
MNKIETDILIIGGGAAGMSAAVSASSKNGIKVTIVDDNPILGGQIWRSELGKIKSPEAQKLIEKLEQNKIQIINNTQVFGQLSEKILLAESKNDVTEFHFEKLVLATGARERFLPFPGWTLPNVFGAGGLQALVKSGFSVENKRVVVAGTGALLLAVTEYLKAKGAKVLLIAEQTYASKLFKFGLGLFKHPSKIFQAVGLRSKLWNIPYLTDSFIVSAEGEQKLRAVNLNTKGKIKRIECDFLACGFHLVPNIELAALLDCKIEKGYVWVDKFQKTSNNSIFCAGEPTGIGGVELSVIEGQISGLTAIGETKKAQSLFSKRQELQQFADLLNVTFSLRQEIKNLPDAETIVCRCEDVTLQRLQKYNSWRTAKLQTRCGMGACQGKICGSAVEFLFDWKIESVRPPIFPVCLENLANFSFDDVKKHADKTDSADSRG